MYINKIDDIIDNVLDDFFKTINSYQTLLNKILNEMNFVKYQKEINKIMSDFTSKINLSEIKELVKSSDAVYTVSETIKRYIGFYFFLTIGFSYSSREDTYINNIVEFTKNQSNYGYKINNFFNSESNAMIIKYNTFIHNILMIINSEPSKIQAIKNKPSIRETIIFLNNLGYEYIEQKFKHNDKLIQSHNIIKTIIILELYKNNEKKEFFRLLELTENIEGEYMFIDIIEPINRYLDFQTIDNMIKEGDLNKNLAHQIWNFVISEQNKSRNNIVSNDDKIGMMIESKLLYPICDDFLLYHKDSEKYDKGFEQSTKKKEDTRIRYIIDKIESVSDLYSEQIKSNQKLTENIKKKFYLPLISRKAILINHIEDVKIINKFLNQGKRSSENNDFFNDLINYKIYPYINFKDFETDGFTFQLKKTVDIIRSVSLNKSGSFKQNKNNYLQLRTGQKDMMINIIGFIIPTNIKPLQCVKIKDIIDLKSLDKKNKNGYDLILKYLTESNINRIKHNSSIYWLFDSENDSVNLETYEQITKFTTQDQIKHIVSKLYDTVIEQIYQNILEQMKNVKLPSLQLFHRIIHQTEKTTLSMSKNSELYDELEIKSYELLTNIESEYDNNDDMVYGFEEKSEKLPEVVIDSKKKIINISIDISGIDEFGKVEIINEVDGICQHNISWDNIIRLRNKNPKQYADYLYNFIQQYVTENADQDYICKSCSYQIDIKKYVTDGIFDDETQRFITFSRPMEVPLEDIPEYEKYKIVIRNIEKTIEKIGNVSNIQIFVGTSITAKFKRKGIVQDTIDLVLMTNSKLKNNMIKRNEIATRAYGIVRDLSNFFIFDLENSIFNFSSKDKDYYKFIKQNNIICFTLFSMLTEISDSNVLFIDGHDKKGLCNFIVFDKIYKTLFQGLRIITNNKKEIKSIIDYKILCYLIYMIICPMIKYNMWYYKYPDSVKKKNYQPQVQKTFVMTLIDTINAILEISLEEGSHYLYEIARVKFFKKLNSTFSNEELYLKLQNYSKFSVSEDKKDFITIQAKPIMLLGKYDKTLIPFVQSQRHINRPPVLYLDIIKKHPTTLNNISNLTNCESGLFHEFKLKGKNYICTLCALDMTQIKPDESLTKKIIQKFKYVRLQLLSQKYCMIDGYHHIFSSEKIGINICRKCKQSDKYEYSHEELDGLMKILEKNRNDQTNTNNNINKQIHHIEKKDSDYVEKVKKTVSEAYMKSGTKSEYIDKFIDTIQSIIGNEINSVNIRENSYIIDHDYLGSSLEKTIMLSDNKIFYKSKHSDFNTDVIYYTSYKGGKIDIFYDAITKILLGYKEESKKIVHNKKPERKIIINYSLLTKIKMLGYEGKYIDIRQQQNNLYETITNIIRQRNLNLKKIISNLQKILYRIINRYNDPIDEDEAVWFANNINKFIEKYMNKLHSIRIVSDSENHEVMKHWKGICRGFYTTDIKDIKLNIDLESKTIDYEYVNLLDTNNNTILFFIISEFDKLISYNSNKIKTNIVNFIIDFINIMFETFNIEKSNSNIDIKRFAYVLNSSTYIQEIIEKSGEKNIEGIYEEYVDDEEEKEKIKEAKEEDKEANDALDMENDYDYEAEYEKVIEE